MTETWVLDDTGIMESLGGVPYWEAPRPRRWHRCRAQTRGILSSGTYVERCACGGVRLAARGPWIERNTARRSR